MITTRKTNKLYCKEILCCNKNLLQQKNFVANCCNKVQDKDGIIVLGGIALDPNLI